MPSPTLRSLELKIPPVALVLLLAASMWGVARLVPATGFSMPGASFVAAAATLAGVLIALTGIVSFRRARTTVNPMHPEAVSRLVVTGIYRWTRNPMYLGMLLALLGFGLLLGNALAIGVALAFVPLMNRLQIAPEERTLALRFGPAFDDFRRSVRRWL